MYRNIRLIHMILGLLAAPLLLMYSVSAIQMGHRSWFNLKPSVRTERIAVDSGCQEPRELARSLMRSQQWRGELTQVETTSAGCSLEISSIGTKWNVRYAPESRSVSVKISQLGVMGVLNRLHHAAGLSHTSSAMLTWGFLVGLVSLALGGLVATGIWLWMLRRRERWLGLVMVAANIVFALTTLVLLRTA